MLDQTTDSSPSHSSQPGRAESFPSKLIHLSPTHRGVQFRVVVSCRGSQVQVAPHNPQRQTLTEGLRATFEKAAAVHCVSEAIKREAEAYGLDPEKAFVIRPAVDAEFFCPSESRAWADHLRVVSVGSLIWTKGYEYTLMAVRRLVDQGLDVRLDINSPALATAHAWGTLLLGTAFALSGRRIQRTAYVGAYILGMVWRVSWRHSEPLRSRGGRCFLFCRWFLPPTTFPTVS